MAKYDYDIIVIGAGAGGLVVAIGAAQAKKTVLLIEKENWGGDCTNFGCIPSKSLIAASHAAHTCQTAKALGLHLSLDGIETVGTLQRTRDIVDSIRKQEEPKALRKKGMDTLTGCASFLDSHTLHVVLESGLERTVSGKKIVVATGSHPFVPDIPGINQVPYLTNETIFDLQIIPKQLTILGGGPIGCELGQAFHRLGTEITIIQKGEHLLAKEEPEASQVIEETLNKEGVKLLLGHETEKIDYQKGVISLSLRSSAGKTVSHSCSHLLVASGRRPSLKSLCLDEAEIQYNERGISVDSLGRTNRKHIWAIGDVTGHALFTHAAENEARTVLKNLLLPWPFRFRLDRKQPIPRVTYTDPEVASCGLSEKEAEKLHGTRKIRCYTIPFSEVDRALTTGRTEGFVKIVTKKWSSTILGATIVAPRAGEMLPQISLAIQHNIPLRKISSLIYAYPTYSLAIRKAADQWFTKTLLPAVRKK